MLQTAAGCDHGPLYLFAQHPSSYTRSSSYSSPGAGAGRGFSSSSTAVVGSYTSGSPFSSGTSYESPSTEDNSDNDHDSPYQSSPSSSLLSPASWRSEPPSSWSYNDNIPPVIPSSSSSFSLSPLPSIESLYPLVVQLLLIYRQLGYSNGGPL